MAKSQAHSLYWLLILGLVIVLVLLYGAYTYSQPNPNRALENFTERGKKKLIPNFERLSVGAKTNLAWQLIRTIESHYYCGLRNDKKCLKKHVAAVKRVFDSEKDRELYYDLLRQRRKQEAPLSKLQTIYMIINRIGQEKAK